MNPWKRFEKLLPASPLDVGTVVAHQTGNSRVQLPAGDVIWAKGTPVTAGGMAYIREGEVVGLAPNLEVVEMDV
ncbi:MAG: hypothetical protein Q8O34_00870 [Rhodocyclaceae bacterium]|nr:hypothetical protein [Rhodocyclaceae bacterium]